MIACLHVQLDSSKYSRRAYPLSLRLNAGLVLAVTFLKREAFCGNN